MTFGLSHFLVLGLAGAFGALSRYFAIQLIGPQSAPWSTMIVNIVGAVLMGVCYVLFVEKAVFDQATKTILMAGFLGAFTTFSTFSLDTFLLIERGEWWLAIMYTLGSVLLCLLGLVLSVSISRMAV